MCRGTENSQSKNDVNRRKDTASPRLLASFVIIIIFFFSIEMEGEPNVPDILSLKPMRRLPPIA